MSYQTADAKRQFDAWSGGYDRNLLQGCFFKPAHRLLLERLTGADRLILDIGCGTSRFAAQVVHRFPGTRVVGLDLSERMLHEGVASGLASGDIDLVQADSECLPFADAAFDAITCSHSFHHYPHQEQVTAEMHRVLRPGGLLMIIDGDRDGLWGRFIFDGIVVLMEGDVRHLSSRAFQELFSTAGFADIRQQRRRGPLPFLLTSGRAVKAAQVVRRDYRLANVG